MKNETRRDFIKKSIIGVSGAAMIANHFEPGHGISESELPSLPLRDLGKTGIRTPLLSMGTTGATTTGFIKAAYASGIKLFFSASYYGEGNNEILVGEALKDIPRESFVIGTAAIPEGMNTRTGTLPKNFSAASYIKTAEGSLKRFGLDRIDILLLPFAGKKETVLNESILNTFEKLKKDGKIYFAGIASHADTEEALDAAAGTGVYDVAMTAYNFKVQNQESLDNAINKAVKSGMGVVAMKTMGGAGKSVNTDAALKWVLQNENISSVVSGMSSLEELQKNIKMLGNLRLTEEELLYLKRDAASTTSLYCQQCRKCVPQCPYNIDIPTVMRSYMYAYGYGNTEHAFHTLEETDIPRNACTNCESCNVNCSSGFNIRKKILDIIRLKDVPKEFLHA